MPDEQFVWKAGDAETFTALKNPLLHRGLLMHLAGCIGGVVLGIAMASSMILRPSSNIVANLDLIGTGAAVVLWSAYGLLRWLSLRVTLGPGGIDIRDWSYRVTRRHIDWSSVLMTGATGKSVTVFIDRPVRLPRWLPGSQALAQRIAQTCGMVPLTESPSDVVSRAALMGLTLQDMWARPDVMVRAADAGAPMRILVANTRREARVLMMLVTGMAGLAWAVSMALSLSILLKR